QLAEKLAGIQSLEADFRSAFAVRDVDAAVFDDEERRAFVALAKNHVVLRVRRLFETSDERLQIFLEQRLEDRDIREQFLTRHRHAKEISRLIVFNPPPTAARSRSSDRCP